MNIKLRTTFLIGLFTAPMLAHAASFDCAKAASATEKLICGSPAVSLLDEQLGQAYKQALTNSADKDSLKQQQIEWLKQQRTCKDTECLTQTYQARIAQLQKGETAASTQPTQTVPVATKAATKKVSFKITEGQGEPLCEEYLKVLNRTAWDDLQACKLPDLTGSSIQELKFSTLTSNERNTLDQIIFEQTGDYAGLKWADFKAAREHQYEIGYRTLGKLNWDLNQDGVNDLIVEDRQPWSGCESVISGDPSVVADINEKRWAAMTDNEKIGKSKIYGFKKHYSLIDNEKLFFIDAENMVGFRGQYFSISHSRFWVKDSRYDDRSKDAPFVYISSINPKLDVKNRQYVARHAVCSYATK